MTLLEDLKKDIDDIKARNKRVEAEKAWETSRTRKLIILVLTYGVIVMFFIVSKMPNPFMSAVVPSLAFVLSTFALPLFKKRWITRKME